MPRKQSKIPKGTVKPLLVSQKEKLEQQKKTRIVRLREKIKNISDPEEIMLHIMDIFKDIEWVPSVGKYYTFIYNAKTIVNGNYTGDRDLDKIYYDQHPLVAVFKIYNWGFEGLNFHWKKIRRYTWEEVAGPLHIITSNDLTYMKSINYMKLKKYRVRQ
jgi:hypothetical protein